MPQNLELKALCADLAAARQAVERLGARPAGVQVQTDTYFPLRTGRLKLREIEGEPAVLIGYQRPDRPEARLSTYRLVPVAEPRALEQVLGDALGVRGRVHKRREIYLWYNVRIHLDAVDGLGTFVEFEAVLSETEDAVTAQARLDELCRVLAVSPSESIAASYIDLLTERCRR